VKEGGSIFKNITALTILTCVSVTESWDHNTPRKFHIQTGGIVIFVT